MTTRVHITKPVLEWAVTRSGKSAEDLGRSNKGLSSWLDGSKDPTLAELRKFANGAHVAYGYLFAQEPPQEELPVPDFRTLPTSGRRIPTADLLDTIYACQRRQDWYHEHLSLLGEEPLEFVGSIRPQSNVVEAAKAIADKLEFEVEDRAGLRSWRASFNDLRDRAERAGILVMTNGMVGLNTHRPLDVKEFRGFALVDDLAPVVFINSRDTLAARIFTLAHELAHIWSGRPGVSNDGLDDHPNDSVERWCNSVAAELLVPKAIFLKAVGTDAASEDELERLAARFKVSTLVILRRMMDCGKLSWDEYLAQYPAEADRIRGIQAQQSAKAGRGPSPIVMAPIRASRSFTSALLADTLEGNTTYRDALGMLGFKDEKSLRKVASNLGIT